jgi:tetratricopeptide (TPR) repeat protein
LPKLGPRIIILALLLASAATAAAVWHVHTSRSSYLLQEGRTQLAEGNWQEAEDVAAKLGQKGHPFHEHLLLGEIWVNRGRSEKKREEARANASTESRQSLADSCFRSALAELSQVRLDGALQDEALVLGAESLVYLGNRPLALDALHKVVARKPDQLQAHRWLAAIYIDLNCPYDAVEHLREWGRLDPDAGRPFRWIGFYYKNYDKPTQAIEAYREALQRHLEPDAKASVQRELAETLVDGESAYQQALEVLAHMDQKDRQDPEMQALEAECLLGLGQTQEAIRLTEKSLQKNPEIRRGLQLRARLWIADGRPEKAILHLQKALQTDPHDLKCRQQLMLVYQQLNDPDRAEKERLAIEESKRLQDRVTLLHSQSANQPWDDQVRLELAELCLKLNHPDEAKMWLQAALAANPVNDQAKKLLSKLGSELVKKGGQAPANR